MGMRCAAMQAINASAEVINTVKCNVDLDKIINIKGFQLEKVLEMDPNFLDVRTCLSAALFLTHDPHMACIDSHWTSRRDSDGTAVKPPPRTMLDLMSYTNECCLYGRLPLVSWLHSRLMVS